VPLCSWIGGLVVAEPLPESLPLGWLAPSGDMHAAVKTTIEMMRMRAR